MKSPLFDDVRQATKDIVERLKACPRCGYANIEYEKPEKRRYFQTLECPICHLRLEVKTRNNERVAWAFLIGIWIFAIPFIIGLILGA